MAKLPGVNHLDAVRALEKAGFRIVEKHIVMDRREYRNAVAEHNPVNAMTMGAIVRTAGLTVDEFRRLL